MSFNIDFGNNNSQTFDDGASTNPTINLFVNPVTVTTNGADQTASTIFLVITNPSSSMHFSLTSGAQTLADSLHITLSFNFASGEIELSKNTIAFGSDPISDADWNTILNGLQYTNSADEPNGATHTVRFEDAYAADGAAYTTSKTSTGTDTLTVTCFYPGALIRTPTGEVAVEALKPGDLVVTHDGRAVASNWIGRQTVSTVFTPKLRVLPVRVKAGALGDNTPTRDLLVSPDHALLVGGILIHAGALVNGTSIMRETDVPKTFTYYHVETDDHSLILAEGAAAETFVDNVDRLGFDNWAEYEALYPQGKTIAELPHPRAKSRRQVPASLRAMLAKRAVAIGAAVEETVAA